MEIKTFASGSSGNLHMVSLGYADILLECGISFFKIRKNIGAIVPDACLLTHYHGDHSKSAVKVMESGTNLYCTKETAEHLRLDHFRLRVIQPEKWYSHATGWRFIAFKTDHDAPGSVCFLIDHGGGRILFATDLRNVPYVFPGLTEIVIECNYLESILEKADISMNERKRIIKTHCGLNDTISFLDRNDLSKVRSIRIVHCSKRHGDSGIFKKAVQKVSGKLTIIS